MKNQFHIRVFLKSNKVRLPYAYAFFALITILVYFNSLGNAFLYDDRFFIVQNIYIRNLKFLPSILRMDVFHFATSPSNYYRPVQILSYSFDYIFWKLNPFGYHLTNIAIHSLNSFLLFLLVFLIFKDKFLALLSGIFFCIHPINAGVVTVIGGRSNILEMMFMLLALVALARYYIHKQSAGYFLAIFSFILAVLSREGALLLPFFIILCGLALQVGKKRLFLNLIPFLAICGLYLVLRAHFLPSDKLQFQGMLSWPRISAFFYLARSYVAQLILPFGLAIKILPQKIAFNLILPSLSFAFILATAALIISKDRIALFGLAFYLLGLLPVLNLMGNISFLGRILSEPYVYMAGAGFFIIIAGILSRLHNRLPKIGAGAIFLIAIFYSSLTVANNLHYKDEAAFYDYVLTVDTKNTIARLNLGNVYLNKKMFKEAQGQARATLAIEPDAWDAYLLLGNIAREKGDLSAAAKFYNRVLALNPVSSEAMNNLGLIYNAQGDQVKAMDWLKRAIAVNPESTLAMQSLADILIARRLYSQALALCDKILKLKPEDISGRVKIGIILAESGHPKEAESIFKDALRLDPDSVEALRNLGVLYANSGDLNKAMSIWSKALSINPLDPETQKNIRRAKAMIEEQRRN